MNEKNEKIEPCPFLDSSELHREEHRCIKVSDAGELAELLHLLGRLKKDLPYHISEFAITVSAEGAGCNFEMRLPSANGYLFERAYCAGRIDAEQIGGNILHEAMRARDILNDAISSAPVDKGDGGPA